MVRCARRGECEHRRRVEVAGCLGDRRQAQDFEEPLDAVPRILKSRYLSRLEGGDRVGGCVVVSGPPTQPWDKDSLSQRPHLRTGELQPCEAIAAPATTPETWHHVGGQDPHPSEADLRGPQLNAKGGPPAGASPRNRHAQAPAADRTRSPDSEDLRPTQHLYWSIIHSELPPTDDV